jgi:alpha,alpha-trehalase
MPDDAATTTRDLQTARSLSAWSLTYTGYDPDQEGLREALCTLGNGYFATRGAAAECVADEVHYPGTYLAGGYNRAVSQVDGHEIENEDLVNLPNWLEASFRLEGSDWFRIDEVQIESFCQELDLRNGVLHRDVRIRDAQGRRTRWRERRLVSMAEPHLGAISIELIAENWSGSMLLRNVLDGDVSNAGVARYRDLEGRHLEVMEVDHYGEHVLLLRCRTKQSWLMTAQAARTLVYDQQGLLDGGRDTHVNAGRIVQEISCELTEGAAVTLEKVVALHTSRDWAISEPGLEVLRTLGRAGRFQALLDAHALAWHQLWELCDIELCGHGGTATQLKLRLHIFHLLQTVSVNSIDLDTGVPARGWHGEAYRGHIFWDEMFIFPYLSLRLPMLARALLRYRHRRLPEARWAARKAGFHGAMYPWQSGSDGREETQRMHLNPRSHRWLPDTTHRQRHINSAIVYNIWQYYQATSDTEFMYAYGAAMVLEIARFWASIATYNPAIDRYEIRGVMGPDEYHTAYPDADLQQAGGIDNNAYTNVMVAWVFNRARDVLELLPSVQRTHLCARLGLAPEEFERWFDIARKLRVAISAEGIIQQFDGYDALEEFDWQGYRARYGDIHRLDRILESEGDTPNRYKVSKQADVLMLFYLLSAQELGLLFEQLGYAFNHDTIPKNVEYYLARTSHGSTLSQLVHAWVLARTDRPRAWGLFQQVLDSDIGDVQGGTTQEGIHLGAMAGTVDLVQRCFLGIEMRANVLHFDPALPDDLECVRLMLHYRSQSLAIEADHDCLRIRSGSVTTCPVTISYRGHDRELAPGSCCEFRLLRPCERDRDENRRESSG